MNSVGTERRAESLGRTSGTGLLRCDFVVALSTCRV
jgi:hypothetical protein